MNQCPTNLETPPSNSATLRRSLVASAGLMAIPGAVKRDDRRACGVQQQVRRRGGQGFCLGGPERHAGRDGAGPAGASAVLIAWAEGETRGRSLCELEA